MGVQKIIVAFGIEIRNHAEAAAMPPWLNEIADEKVRDKVWTYPKGAGTKARFEVDLVYTMDEFAKALDTEGAVVIYSGHSRDGQGPAFGPSIPSSWDPAKDGTYVPDKKSCPVNPWGVHFRMGYDATDIECVGDL